MASIVLIILYFCHIHCFFKRACAFLIPVDVFAICKSFGKKFEIILKFSSMDSSAMTLNGWLRYTTRFVLAVFVLSGLVHHAFSIITYSVPISNQALSWGTMGGVDIVGTVAALKGGDDITAQFPSSFNMSAGASEFTETSDQLLLRFEFTASTVANIGAASAQNLLYSVLFTNTYHAILASNQFRMIVAETTTAGGVQ